MKEWQIYQSKKEKKASLLSGLHEVCSHIMAQWDLFIYLSMRVEGLSRGLVSTHVRIADIYFYFVAINFTLLTYLSMQVIIMHLKFMASVAYSEKAVVPVSVKGII